MAVVDLAETAQPLTGNTDRTFTLFGEARRVDDEGGLTRPTEVRIDLLCNALKEWFGVPGRAGNEMMGLMVLEVTKLLVDALDITEL